MIYPSFVQLALQLNHLLSQMFNRAVRVHVILQHVIVLLLQLVLLRVQLKELVLQMLQSLLLVLPRLPDPATKLPEGGLQFTGVLQSLLVPFLALLFQILVLRLQQLVRLLQRVESLHRLYAILVPKRFFPGRPLLELLFHSCVRALLLGQRFF